MYSGYSILGRERMIPRQEQKDCIQRLVREQMQMVGVKMPRQSVKQLESITPNKSEYIRRLVEHSLKEDKDTIQSGDWKALKNKLDVSPSLLVHGMIGCGKSYTVRNMVLNSNDKIFILFDLHDEHEGIPIITLDEFLLKPNNINESKRVVLSSDVAYSKLQMKQIIDFILMRRINSSYILIFEESARNSRVLEQLATESRKFIKCLFVSAKKIFDFIPSVKIIKGGEQSE